VRREKPAGNTEKTVASDFSAARLHLERAYHYLSGGDDTSRKACEALDVLIEAVAVAECTRPKGEVVTFPGPRRPAAARQTSNSR
jgi:hypothetical protein